MPEDELNAAETRLPKGKTSGRPDLRPDALVERYFMDVYSVCFRHLGHPQDAEDATQETFTSVFRKPEKLAAADSPRAWILTVARNIAISQFRTRGRTRPLAVEPEEAPPVSEPVDRDRFHEALGELSSKDRDLIRMKYIDRMSAEQMAADSGLSLSAVRTALCRALKRFRALYHAGNE